MKAPLFYSKILLFGEYGIIKNSKGLSIPYNFLKGVKKQVILIIKIKYNQIIIYQSLEIIY